MKPSNEQKRVLDTKNKNIIVSASAGSGKTTVMTAKIKNFILEGNSVKDILVLTYTKAAATEMKQRLEKKLLEENTEYMQQEIDNLSVADISTFHSYCQKLLKKYFYVLGINPNFEILEDIEEKILLDKSYNDAIKKVSMEKEEDYIYTLETFFTGRNDNSLREMVFTIKTFFDSSLDENFKDKALNFFDSDFASNYIDKLILANISYYLNQLEKLQVYANSYGFDAYTIYINNLISQLLEITKVDFVKKLQLIKMLNYGVLRALKNDEIGFKDKINLVKTKLKKFTDQIKEKNYGTLEDFEKVRVNSKKIISTLFSIYENMSMFYKQRKNKLNKFDYSDLERYTLTLLQDEKVRNTIKQKYKLICIDEFQDANLLQETIISLLSKKDNRFMVGDVKQSIYAFRQSNPDIFLSIEEKYKNDKDSTSLTLNDNYRSNKNILDYVNLVFSKIMTKQTTGIDYEKDAKFNGVAEYKDDGIKEVTIDIIESTSKENFKHSGLYSVKNNKFVDDEESLAEKEALLVANRILELTSKKIYDKELGDFREVKFDDICILLRSRGNYQKLFASVLADAGIPIAINSNSLLFETPEGKTCLNFLEVISNSKNDICLALTMTSLLFEFNENQLSKIRLNHKDDSFYEAVKCYDKNDEIKNKIDNMFNVIKDFRQDMEFYGIYEALNNIYNKCNLFEKCSLYPDGESKILNYKTFLNLFKGDISLDEFLSSNLSPTVVNLSCDNSAVDITTIHSSKGLEYPIVFVCNLGADFYKDNKNNNLIISKNYGMATKVADLENRKVLSSLYFDTLKDINKNQDFAEKIRLLYVALTRAKNHLFLVGTKSKLDFKEFTSDFEVLNSSCYLDLIINSLNVKDIENLIEKRKFENEHISINIFNEQQDFPKEETEKINLALIDNDKVDELFNYLNFQIKIDNIAFKNSVSSLNKEEYVNVSLEPKNLSIKEHLNMEELSARGTTVHKVLELVNFNDINTLNDLTAFVNHLVEIKEIDEINFDINKLFNNILTLKQIAKGNILKEKTFVMKVPYNEVIKSNITDKILVQGIVDLIILGEKNIIIDYKLTSIQNDEKLKEKYHEQLKLYKMAVEKGLNLNIDEVYLFNLNKNKLILM